MLPPRPPSPPSGPPRGTYFSRRKDAEPSPPLPAMTSIFASSKNFILLEQEHGGHGVTAECCIRRFADDREDAIDPLVVLGLHQHRAQARERVAVAGGADR